MNVVFTFNGKELTLQVCALTLMKVPPPSLFQKSTIWWVKFQNILFLVCLISKVLTTKFLFLMKIKPYTTFEATSKLYEFNSAPFRLTNGVTAFQSSTDNVIEENELEDSFAYVDNISVCGMNQEEYDTNLKPLYETAKKRNMTSNHNKSISTTCIKLLGYVISKGSIQPDQDRMKRLKELLEPNTLAEQRCTVGMFAHYSKWIPTFSDKIRPLIQNNVFPLPENALQAFQNSNVEIENPVVSTIDETIPFKVETDASDFTIASMLNQAGRPFAFSRSLSETERRHSALEKEANAIVESIRAWEHYL